jgi:hypothetical protein
MHQTGVDHFLLTQFMHIHSIGVPVSAQTDAGDSSILAEEILLKVFDATGAISTSRSGYGSVSGRLSFYGVTCYERRSRSSSSRAHSRTRLSSNHLVGTI